MLFPFLETFSQCDILNDLGLIDAPSISLQANAECTDADGWTHYYNSNENKLILSIKKNGQDIGTLGSGLSIESGTRADYGNIGFNLSDADYINFDIWMVANRSWQITGANPISSPIKIRSYFNATDTSDINKLNEALGIFFNYDIPEKSVIYTIGQGGGLGPYETQTQPTGAVFGFFNSTSSPAATYGILNGFFYGEIEETSTDLSGGTGLLFFADAPKVAIFGKVEKADNSPVPDVDIEIPGRSVRGTDVAGNYFFPNINTNLDYEIIPQKNTDPREGISVTDLILLSRQILGVENFTSPFQYIAADADNNTDITGDDVFEILDILLGETSEFQNNSSWRFAPQAYVFPDQNDPFTPPFPESIILTNVPDTMFNQNFTGIKIGDIGEASNNPPPALNTTFLFSNEGACSAGEEVVFDLTAADFQGIRGFQFTLDWDKDRMAYVAVENINLPGLSMQNIGESAAPDGQLAFAWFTSASGGATMLDGETICQIRFATTANVSSITPLSFSGNIVEDKVVYQNLAEGVPSFVNGSLDVSNNSDIVAEAFIEQADCDGTAIGSIDLTVSGTTGNVNFNWSNGETTEDISNLAPDIYTVTITDASGNCPKVAEFEIVPGGQFDIIGNVQDMTCPTVIDGSIDLAIGNGAGPFTFLWSNGETTDVIDGLYRGTYEVTVTDAAGCTQTASFEVKNNNRIFPQVTVLNSSNTGTSNGSIMINDIIGGSPPFTFLWSNGATTQSIMDVPPGDYSVTISDGIGCGHVFGYLVHDLMVATGEVNGVSLNIGIFPNPVVSAQSYTLAVESPVSGQVQAAVFSTNGQLIYKNEMTLQEGMNEKELPAPGSSGLYFIQILWENEIVGWLKMVVRN